MGYRDDATALAARRDILQRELAELTRALTALDAEGAQLRQRVRRQRFRLALARAWRWMKEHPKTTTTLLLILSICGYVGYKRYQQHRQHQLQVERALGRDCRTELQVDASFRGARVWVGGVEVGAVPLEVPICPGYYRVQVIHDKALPWQRVIHVGVQPELRLQAALVPFWPSQRPRDSILVFSDPPGAILFANGSEVGRTPVQLEASALGGDRLRLALWSSSVAHPIRLWNGDKKPRALWFHLGRQAMEAR